MDEAEWLACSDPEPMLESLKGKFSDRKLRLFTCACVRHVWPLLRAVQGPEAVMAGEGYAEGLVEERKLEAVSRKIAAAYSSAKADLRRAYGASRDEGEAGFAVARALDAARAAVSKNSYRGAQEASVRVAHAAGTEAARAGAPATYDEPETYGAAEMDGRQRAYRYQAALLRDIFGNPFRPVVFDIAWRTPIVVALATAAYEERSLPAGTLDHERLAVLADALQESGCTDAEILSHLGIPSGPHVRGCWALDAILFKE
jgi:hypothetical protein